MKAAGVLIVVLSQQGHWFGGQEGTISVNWAVRQNAPAAVLTWDLLLGEVRMEGGQLALDAGTEASVLHVRLPEVRTRTTFRWVYRATRRDDGKLLTEGEVPLEVYPANLMAGLSRFTKNKKVLVWDSSSTLSLVLTSAGVEHRRVQEASELRMAQADVVLVAPDEIDAGLFSQPALLGHAEAGAGVFVFVQSRPRLLADYELGPRTVPPKPVWRMDHPLLAGFREGDLDGLLVEKTMQMKAVRLPPGEPALEIGFWPSEAAAQEPSPIDAMLVTKAVGQGRIVLCQVPLARFSSDPRAQGLLANALRYFATRPEPTPPSSRRAETRPAFAETLPAIIIPPGGAP